MKRSIYLTGLNVELYRCLRIILKKFFWKNLVIVFNVQYNRRKITLKRNVILIDKSYQNKLQSYNSGDDKRVLRIKNGRKNARYFCTQLAKLENFKFWKTVYRQELGKSPLG